MDDSLVKPFVAFLSSDKTLMVEALPFLEKHFGPCDYRGDWKPFSHSSYYEAEMGGNLHRCMISFENLLPGWIGADFKKWTGAIEESFSDEHGHRRINLDPGYVDNLKVVLLSGKSGGHKVSVAEGIWADMLLWYNKGWVAFPWAFPDFRDGTYFDDFVKMRKMFKQAYAEKA